MRGRAYRRLQAQRHKARARRMARLWRFMEPDDPALVGIMARTRVRCSCWMCGHRRKWFGPPVAERRREEIADLDIQSSL